MARLSRTDIFEINNTDPTRAEVREGDLLALLEAMKVYISARDVGFFFSAPTYVASINNNPVATPITVKDTQGVSDPFTSAPLIRVVITAGVGVLIGTSGDEGQGVNLTPDSEGVFRLGVKSTTTGTVSLGLIDLAGTGLLVSDTADVMFS